MKYFIAISLVLLQFLQINGQTCLDIGYDCDCKLGLCYNLNYVDNMFKMCQKACGWCDKTVDDVRGDLEQRYTKRPRDPTQPGPMIPGPAPGAPAATRSATAAATTCVDTIFTCSSQRSMCSVAAYKTLMKTKCSKTCGFC